MVTICCRGWRFEMLEAVVDEIEAGIFTWCLETDTLFGDSAVGELFGLDPADTLKGLPIGAYLSRIVEEDRIAVASAISQAVRDGQPYRAEYHVIDSNGDVRPVAAFGRCFRDKTGNPIHYAGIVHPLDQL
jgi:PAS domain S-box-containing protein